MTDGGITLQRSSLNFEIGFLRSDVTHVSSTMHAGTVVVYIHVVASFALTLSFEANWAIELGGCGRKRRPGLRLIYLSPFFTA